MAFLLRQFLGLHIVNFLEIDLAELNTDLTVSFRC